MATNLVTEVALEVLHEGVAKPRVTTLAAEVLHSGAAKPRVTTIAVEVLRSIADVGPGDATGTADLPTIVITPPDATAFSPVSGTGEADLPTITIMPPTAAASVTYFARADLPTITITPPAAAAAGTSVAKADLPTIRITAPEARAFGTGPRVSELGVLALAEVVPATRVSELAVLVAVEGPPPPVKVSELAALIAGEVVPGLQVSEMAVLVLAESQPCVTERCQIWAIHRRDGVVMRYTSLDQDVVWGGFVYSKCYSLDPSASESASTIGSVGSIELTGIIDDSGISEADLYGGVYDDAFVEVWLISWGDVSDTPKRIAAGNTGELSQGEQGHKFEVVGPGARLDQQAVVQAVTGSCRWTFGDPVTCKVDREALKIEGQVLDALDRGAFHADLSSLSTGPQWANGLVRWTSGRNLAYENEVKHVDFDTGVVTLWALTAYVPGYGDTFDLLPGCDKLKTGGCRLYDNIINHGGFADLPGDDSMQDTPDAQVE